MINKSHFLNALVFTLAIVAWIQIKTIDYTLVQSSILKDIYLSAFGATCVIYVASVIFKNVSLYDTYWGLQGALLSLNYFLYSNKNVDNPRAFIATVLSCIWSIRLVFIFILYSWNDIHAEDWRNYNFINYTLKKRLSLKNPRCFPKKLSGLVQTGPKENLLL
jgi:steroid 5-alpha reductase family enzyme